MIGMVQSAMGTKEHSVESYLLLPTSQPLSSPFWRQMMLPYSIQFGGDIIFPCGHVPKFIEMASCLRELGAI